MNQRQFSQQLIKVLFRLSLNVWNLFMSFGFNFTINLKTCYPYNFQQLGSSAIFVFHCHRLTMWVLSEYRFWYLHPIKQSLRNTPQDITLLFLAIATYKTNSKTNCPDQTRCIFSSVTVISTINVRADIVDQLLTVTVVCHWHRVGKEWKLLLCHWRGSIWPIVCHELREYSNEICALRPAALEFTGQR